MINGINQRLGSAAAGDQQLLEQLRASFPGHRIWRGVRYDGQFGDWVATLHVRHEALFVRMEVRDRPFFRRRSGGLKLEAA